MGMTHFVENTKRNTKQGVMITKPNSTYGEKTHTVWQPNPTPLVAQEMFVDERTD